MTPIKKPAWLIIDSVHLLLSPFVERKSVPLCANQSVFLWSVVRSGWLTEWHSVFIFIPFYTLILHLYALCTYFVFSVAEPSKEFHKLEWLTINIWVFLNSLFLFFIFFIELLAEMAICSSKFFHLHLFCLTTVTLTETEKKIVYGSMKLNKLFNEAWISASAHPFTRN